MRKPMFALFTLVVVGTAIATAPALAQQIIGGHNETSEVNAPLWAVGAPTPGAVPGHGANHLLVTEVAVTPTPVEFIEIHNPTANAVDLTKYYLTDAWFTTPAPRPPRSASTGTTCCPRGPW